jgi:hypothetical protein
MRKKILAVFSFLAIALPSIAYAHSGGLDRNGCHHERKTGSYHCH